MPIVAIPLIDLTTRLVGSAGSQTNAKHCSPRSSKSKFPAFRKMPERSHQIGALYCEFVANFDE